MSRPSQLSRRLSAQLGADVIELVQTDPFDADGPSVAITLTPDTAAKLIPLLERFVGKARKRQK